MLIRGRMVVKLLRPFIVRFVKARHHGMLLIIVGLLVLAGNAAFT